MDQVDQGEKSDHGDQMENFPWEKFGEEGMSTQLDVKAIKTLQMTFYTCATVGRHIDIDQFTMRLFWQ